MNAFSPNQRRNPSERWLLARVGPVSLASGRPDAYGCLLIPSTYGLSLGARQPRSLSWVSGAFNGIFSFLMVGGSYGHIKYVKDIDRTSDFLPTHANNLETDGFVRTTIGTLCLPPQHQAMVRSRRELSERASPSFFTGNFSGASFLSLSPSFSTPAESLLQYLVSVNSHDLLVMLLWQALGFFFSLIHGNFGNVFILITCQFYISFAFFNKK